MRKIRKSFTVAMSKFELYLVDANKSLAKMGNQWHS